MKCEIKFKVINMFCCYIKIRLYHLNFIHSLTFPSHSINHNNNHLLEFLKISKVYIEIIKIIIIWINIIKKNDTY